MLLYKKPDIQGQTPQIFTVRCNCPSSKADATARYVDANRGFFMTPEQFLESQRV
jgi:hypothetical protein